MIFSIRPTSDVHHADAAVTRGAHGTGGVPLKLFIMRLANKKLKEAEGKQVH